jgi:hypothetical protein
MRRLFALLLAGIIALMPLAGMAGQPEAASAGHDMPCHAADTGPADEAPASCTDMKGCCAAVLVPAASMQRASRAPDERTARLASLTAGFVPDPADRPPVS